MFVLFVCLVMSPRGAVVPRLRFEIGHRGVSESCNWYVGRQEACETSFFLTENECCTLKKRLTTGFGRTMPGHRAGSDRPHPWLVMAGRSWRRRQLFLIYICIVLKIHGDYWQDAGMAKSVPRSTVTGLEWRGQGPHFLWPPPKRLIVVWKMEVI